MIYSAALAQPSSESIMQNLRQNIAQQSPQFNQNIEQIMRDRMRQEEEKKEEMLNENAENDQVEIPVVQGNIPEEIPEENNEQLEDINMIADENIRNIPAEQIPLLQQFLAPQPEDNQDPEYETWRQQFASYMINEIKTNREKLLAFIMTSGFQLYQYYRENQFKNTLGNPELANLTRDELEQKSLPSHCRRHIYFNEKGEMKSIVFCNSHILGDTIHHEIL